VFVDKLTENEKVTSSPARELISVLSNIGSPFFGGLPSTSKILKEHALFLGSKLGSGRTSTSERECCCKAGLDAMLAEDHQFPVASLIRMWETGDDEATPEGIAVLNDLNFVLIADTCEHVIRVFDDQENPVSIWGSFGVGAGAFDSPCAISVHVSTGLVVVADRGNNRIQVKLMVICELSS
jgi:hypothetical protein